MKQWAAAAAVLLLCCGAAAAAAPVAAPQRIMSLKLCTDALLMDLVPPERIASISYLSREQAVLRLWPQAARIPVNHNSIEEVLSVHPDLILTDAFESPAMRALLAKSGARIVEVPDAENFEQIRSVTRLVADAVGGRPRAEQLIAQMDTTLRRLEQEKPARAIRVAGWGAGGFVPGQNTLFNAVLEAAGGSNIAGPQGGYYDIERLIAARPDALAYGDNYIGLPSLHSEQDNHPALLKLFGNRRIVYASGLVGCGVPQSADAASQLHAALSKVMGTP
jgi:iron complex transport system substrate-binding protein